MPYSDYKNFDRRYFNPNDGEEFSEGYGQYDSANGAGSIDYNTFIENLETLTGADPTILIVGCGTGVSVKGCRNQSNQIDEAYGMDISQWAIDNHAPGISQSVIQGDAQNASAFESAQDEWKVNQAFDVIYTEFVLSHYTDQEARNIHQNCVDYVSHGGNQRGTVLHRMWSGNPGGWEENGFNVKTVAEWQNLFSDIALDGVTVEWIDYDSPSDSTV